MKHVDIDPETGLHVVEDMTGAERKLGLLQPTPQKLMVRAGKLTYPEWLARCGLGVLPRSQWKPVDGQARFDTRFINNQKNCGGCVGWSCASAATKLRYSRGYGFQMLSGAYVYAHINGGRDGGAMILDSLTAIQRNGTCWQSTMDYPSIFLRQVPSGADAEAARHKEFLDVSINSFDEVCDAIQRGLFPQFPINVGGNFENFDKNGVAGASRGGNHSVHGAGLAQFGSLWFIWMPNSWGTSWGPFSNGSCYLSENAIAWAASNDSYVHVDLPPDPQGDNPPVPVAA